MFQILFEFFATIEFLDVIPKQWKIHCTWRVAGLRILTPTGDRLAFSHLLLANPFLGCTGTLWGAFNWCFARELPFDYYYQDENWTEFTWINLRYHRIMKPRGTFDESFWNQRRIWFSPLSSKHWKLKEFRRHYVFTGLLIKIMIKFNIRSSWRRMK